MATLAYAHNAALLAPTEAWSDWHLDPGLLTLLVLTCLLYALMGISLRKRRPAEKRRAQRRTVSFVLGLLLLYGTLASPLDGIGERMTIDYPIALAERPGPISLVWFLPFMFWAAGTATAFLAANHWLGTGAFS